jgi:hypothetical protein
VLKQSGYGIYISSAGQRVIDRSRIIVLTIPRVNKRKIQDTMPIIFVLS